MAINYFFAARINIVSVSFDPPFRQTSHEKFRLHLKVPVDRRRKKSNDMIVDAAPTGGEARPASLPKWNASEVNAGVV